MLSFSLQHYTYNFSSYEELSEILSFFLYKAFSVLYAITISQGLISNFILSYFINLALNLRDWQSMWRVWGRPRRRWEDNIKIDLQKVGKGRGWMELAQDRDRWRALVGTVRDFRVP